MDTAIFSPQNPNRRLIMKSLGYNDWGYDNLIHQFFVTWCEAMATKFYHSDRSLIASEPLFNYYKNQWETKVENAMVNDYGIYLKKNIPNSAEAFYKILYEYAMDLEKHYPSSLLRSIKSPVLPKYQFNYN